MFISCGIAKITIAEFTRECAIFIGALIVVLALVTYRSAVMLLPDLLLRFEPMRSIRPGSVPIVQADATRFVDPVPHPPLPLLTRLRQN